MASDLRIESGQRIRERREQLGLSLNEAARRADVPAPYYWRIEHGEVGSQGPGDDVRMRIAAALKSQVHDLWIYPQRKAS